MGFGRLHTNLHVHLSHRSAKLKHPDIHIRIRISGKARVHVFIVLVLAWLCGEDHDVQPLYGDRGVHRSPVDEGASSESIIMP